MTTDLVAYVIYPDRASFEAALEAFRAAGLRNSDISAILPERDRTTKDLDTKSTPRLPRVRRLVPEPGRPSAASRMARRHRSTGHSGNRAFGGSGAHRRGPGRRRGRGRNGWTRRRHDWRGYPEVEAKRYAGRIREGGTSSPSTATTASGAGARRRSSKPPVVSTSSAPPRPRRTIVRDAGASLNRFPAVIVGGHPQPDRLCALVVVGQAQPFSTIAFSTARGSCAPDRCCGTPVKRCVHRFSCPPLGCRSAQLDSNFMGFLWSMSRISPSGMACAFTGIGTHAAARSCSR